MRARHGNCDAIIFPVDVRNMFFRRCAGASIFWQLSQAPGIKPEHKSTIHRSNRTSSALHIYPDSEKMHWLIVQHTSIDPHCWHRQSVARRFTCTCKSVSLANCEHPFRSRSVMHLCVHIGACFVSVCVRIAIQSASADQPVQLCMRDSDSLCDRCVCCLYCLHYLVPANCQSLRILCAKLSPLHLHATSHRPTPIVLHDKRCARNARDKQFATRLNRIMCPTLLWRCDEKERCDRKAHRNVGDVVKHLLNWFMDGCFVLLDWLFCIIIIIIHYIMLLIYHISSILVIIIIFIYSDAVEKYPNLIGCGCV